MSLHRAMVFAFALFCCTAGFTTPSYAAAAGTLSFHSSATAVVQNNGSINVMVIRTGGSSGTVSVRCATANSTAVAGKDYTAVSTTLSWANGETAPKNCTVRVSDAIPFSGQKTFLAQLSGVSGAALGTNSRNTVTIYGNKGGGTVSVSASSYSVTQSTGNIAVTVNRTGGSAGTGVVSYATANATAIAGSDYTAAKGMLKWEGGDATPKIINIPIGNTPFTGTKTLAVAIAGPSNVVLGSPNSAIVTIQGAATAPVVTAPAAASCSGSSGPLTLKASITRASGVSPLMVFFDATGTTDSSVKANASAFQDVHYSWDFGDTGTSGTGSTWAYGSNPGRNNKNTASGGVAGHMYMTPGRDQIYTATVTADDGTNKASCQLGVTAYDPAGVNGFAGTNTTCVSASGTPTPGAGGCPSGAAVLSTSALATALGASHLADGKRVLFKCGDTFTGHEVFIGAVTKWTVGAYGGCENTQTNRPIFSFSGSADGSGILVLGVGSNVPGDGRLVDFDCEGNSFASQGCTTFAGNSNRIPYQMTQYNLRSNGSRSNYYWSHGAQMALIGSVATGMRSSIGTFINVDGNGTGTWSGTPINNINYQAMLGNSLAGTGDTGGGGDEAVRIGACMYCVFANNTFKDGNAVGATFKLFESNNHGTGGSQTSFAGIPVQYVEISDNLFTGESGAQLAEVSPQANSFDERFYDIVIERNLFIETHDNLGNFLLLSGERETVRDNVFFIGSGFVHPSFFSVQIAERAGANCGSSPCPSTSQTTQHTEVYNNTGYALSFRFPQSLVAFSNAAMSGNAGNNSWVQNNLYYTVGSGATVVTNSGSGNTVSNNTINTSANPGILDASGAHNVLTDFQPTANYSGGVTVPVLQDALNQPWPSTWDLGAIQH